MSIRACTASCRIGVEIGSPEGIVAERDSIGEGWSVNRSSLLRVLLPLICAQRLYLFSINGQRPRRVQRIYCKIFDFANQVHQEFLLIVVMIVSSLHNASDRVEKIEGAMVHFAPLKPKGSLQRAGSASLDASL